VRSAAAEALGRLGKEAAGHQEVLRKVLQALEVTLADPNGSVRSRAAGALGNLWSFGLRIFRKPPESEFDI
jgi:HEAT repeat protein